MKKINFRKRRILYPLFFALLLITALYVVVQKPFSGEVKVKAQRVSGGWGYQVLVNNRVFIDQPIIPVLEGNRAFPNRRSALKAGTIVKKKLQARQLPNLTREDLEKIGIDSLENSN
jgi:hypothetical protein